MRSLRTGERTAMPIWTLAKKELRLLLRDRLAAILLLGMPFVAILLLGLLLGEGFWQKPDEKLRVSVVDLDRGDVVGDAKEAAAYLAMTPGPGQLSGLALVEAHHKLRFPRESWAKMVIRDLELTAEIRVEEIPSREEAKRLCSEGKRAAVLVFGPSFSEKVAACSFLADGLNPFYRDGVNMPELDVELIKDDTQVAAAKIIEQVGQVTLLRVVLPWMIGKAFEKLGDPGFIDKLGEEVQLPTGLGGGKVQLKTLLRSPEHKAAVGNGVQNALRTQFPKYEL